MGNAVTTSTCNETISDRLPWVIDTFKIINRVPMRTISQPKRYEKENDEEESSEKESEKENNSEKSKENEEKEQQRSSWLWGLIGMDNNEKN